MAERDGCDCPVNVKRCIHWEGNTLLMSAEQGQRPDCAHTYQVMPGASFEVVLLLGTVAYCPYCGIGRGRHQWQVIFERPFDSEADALAAFFEAERELLGRLRDD